MLVNFDVRRNKSIWSEDTLTALTHLWEQQQDDGAWLWLEFGLRPWESDSGYFGASLAAVAVGMVGKDYQGQPAVEPKVAVLKKYLRTRFASQPLHHRVMGLWADSWLPGSLDDEKAKLIEELIQRQEADGGWSLAKLGKSGAKSDWKAHGAYPESTLSDGYATGLVVLARSVRGSLPTTRHCAKPSPGCPASSRTEPGRPIIPIDAPTRRATSASSCAKRPVRSPSLP